MSNPKQRSQIIELYRKCGGDVFRVAREMGLRPSEIRKEITPTLHIRAEFPDEQRKPTRNRAGHLELGRESLRPFIIAYRHAHAGWPENYRSVLSNARQSYDAGTHIMIQGRDGCWIIQYLWKRDKVRPPLNWFYGAFA